MHNSGFNCVACQVLILPSDWEHTDALLAEVERVIATMPARGLYYPGAQDRLDSFQTGNTDVTVVSRQGGTTCLVQEARPGEHVGEVEVFAPALTVVKLPGDANTFLSKAIAYANNELHGTLGANVLIHPASRKAIGEDAFETHMIQLRYGTIAINAWTGLAFLMTQCTWGAFPGHTLDDVQSGIGVVHNTFMFDEPQRTVVTAPFRPFPRTVLSGGMTLLPRPPWFVTNKKGAQLGERLTRFQYKPGWLKIPTIFVDALQG